MKKDPAIEEIRAVRHKISKRFGHNTKALLDHYREMEKEYPDRMLPSVNAVSRPRSGKNPKTSQSPRNSKSTH
jgi:hypothetical protein